MDSKPNNFSSGAEYISLADAEKISGVSKDYFRLCIKKGYLRGAKFGRNWVTTRAWLDEYLNSYRNGNGIHKVYSIPDTPEDAAAYKTQVASLAPSAEIMERLKREVLKEIGRKALAVAGIAVFFSAAGAGAFGIWQNRAAVAAFFDKQFSAGGKISFSKNQTWGGSRHTRY